MAKLGAILSTSDIGVPGSLVSPTPGATVTITVTAGAVFKWTSGENETVNASGTQIAGQMVTLIITNDATLARTITLGTGFASAGVLIGTTLKTAVLNFVSDGTTLWEMSRTAAL